MEIRQFMKGINFIREEIHKDIAFPQLTIFLIVAENKGITQGELAQMLKIPKGTVSRNVIKLGDLPVQDSKGIWKQRGYELVEQIPDKYDPRANACYLTKKGRQVYNDLKEAIK